MKTLRNFKIITLRNFKQSEYKFTYRGQKVPKLPYISAFENQKILGGDPPPDPLCKLNIPLSVKSSTRPPPS